MALEPLDSPATAPYTLPISTANIFKFKTAKRSNNRIRRNYLEAEYLAMCLVKIARRGDISSASSSTASSEGNRAASPAAADVKKVQEPKSHACSVCNKSFLSHQALGGHKASHYHPKPSTAAAAAVDYGNLRNGIADQLPALINSSGRLHECSVCHKTFPTGQALGGHKRKHFEGVIGGAASKRRTSDGGSAAKSRTSDGGSDSKSSTSDGGPAAKCPTSDVGAAGKSSGSDGGSVTKSRTSDGGAVISAAAVVYRDFDLNVALPDLYCDEVESALLS